MDDRDQEDLQEIMGMEEGERDELIRAYSTSASDELAEGYKRMVAVITEVATQIEAVFKPLTEDPEFMAYVRAYNAEREKRDR